MFSLYLVKWKSRFSLQGFELNCVSVRNQATENASSSVRMRAAVACDHRGCNVPDALPSIFPGTQDPPDNLHHFQSCVVSYFTQRRKVWFIFFTLNKGYPKTQEHKKNFFSFNHDYDSATMWVLITYLMDNQQLQSLYLESGKGKSYRLIGSRS